MTSAGRRDRVEYYIDAQSHVRVRPRTNETRPVRPVWGGNVHTLADYRPGGNRAPGGPSFPQDPQGSSRQRASPRPRRRRGPLPFPTSVGLAVDQAVLRELKNQRDKYRKHARARLLAETETTDDDRRRWLRVKRWCARNGEAYLRPLVGPVKLLLNLVEMVVVGRPAHGPGHSVGQRVGGQRLGGPSFGAEGWTGGDDGLFANVGELFWG